MRAVEAGQQRRFVEPRRFEVVAAAAALRRAAGLEPQRRAFGRDRAQRRFLERRGRERPESRRRDAGSASSRTPRLRAYAAYGAFQRNWCANTSQRQRVEGGVVERVRGDRGQDPRVERVGLGA